MRKQTLPRTLSRCWELCLEMWKDIAFVVKLSPYADIDEIKSNWLKQHGFGDFCIKFNCFFCQWAFEKGQPVNQPYQKGGCPECPGTKINPNFTCELFGKRWDENPVEFYNYLVKLDKNEKIIERLKRREHGARPCSWRLSRTSVSSWLSSVLQRFTN